MSAGREHLLGDYQSSEGTYNVYDNAYNVNDNAYNVNFASSARRMPRVCGPKLSNCCLVLSLWGLLMLVLMGLFFRMESVALLEDLPPLEGDETTSELYQTQSMNCFVVAGLYGAVLLLASYQKFAINRGYSRF